MYKDILLTVDLANHQTHGKAVETAITLAQAYKARLHVISVVPDFGMSIVGNFFPKDYEKQVIESANKQLHEFTRKAVPPDIQVQHIVGHGPVYKEIIHYADKTDCDLIIMAAHRPELSDYLLGPNAARVVRHAKQSVLVVRD
jgi:nucleotide-binding universal stress UspA family protein